MGKLKRARATGAKLLVQGVQLDKVCNLKNPNEKLEAQGSRQMPRCESGSVDTQGSVYTCCRKLRISDFSL